MKNSFFGGQAVTLLFPHKVRHIGLLVPSDVTMFHNMLTVNSIETVRIGTHEINGILDIEISQRLGKVVESDMVALHHDDFPVTLTQGPSQRGTRRLVVDDQSVIH